jgi:subtilase family serine protease
MIQRLSIFLLTLAVMVTGANLVCQAAPLPLVTRHTRDAVVSGEAKSVGHLPATQTMHLNIMLALRHAPELENFLQEVYDPSSSSYRHFLTVEEFTARFGASKEDYDATVAFAKANGFTVLGTSTNRMTLDVAGSVATAEKAFHVTMGLYQHPTENRKFYAPDREPTADLSVQLWHISGMDNYSIPKPLVKHRNIKVHSEATVGSCPQQSFCGSDMRAAYYGGTALTGAGQYVALFEYEGTDLADLATYYKNANQTNNVPVSVVSVDGTPATCFAAQGCDDTEQTLDMTQALGMAPGLSGLTMFVGSTDSAIFNKIATTKPLSAQVSSSWYWNPADPQTLNPIFQEMAAQGQNIFDAAGDHAKWGASIWPADNAYLVSVGGTDLTTQSAGGAWSSETAWSDGGGGISPNKIPIPSWQVATAAGCSNCSQTLRNAPDVSANSNFTFYVCADQTTCTANEYGGTSFAAPMWAGYLALVNQQAVANGNPVLGFINPAIYGIGLGSSYTTDFHDIVAGSNGYAAVKGFDLATGWGSPNGNALITALAGGGGGGGPVVSLSPTSLTWAGKKALGVKAAAKAVTLTNTGSATLTISTIATSGDFALATVTKTKKITPCVNGGTVAAGASCEVKVTFTPTEAGARTGDLTFTDNAPNSPQTVALSGTGK